jgi:outer membrane lipoprotein-sorting protein
MNNHMTSRIHLAIDSLRQRAARVTSMLAAAIVMVAAPAAMAQAPSAHDLALKSSHAFYYAGKDLKTQISMRLMNDQGAVRERQMVMLRTNQGNTGDQRYLIIFDAPADVRGMGFLVWKNAKGEDDRWLYFPALKSVKRVAADDKRSSFVGSDFTYEDVSGRDVDEETHVLLKEDTVGGRKAYVLESKPKAAADYARRLSWIDQERWLPLREEYYDAAGKLQRTFSADQVEQVNGTWTATRRSMSNALTGHKTEVVLKATQYDSGLSADLFTERQLRNPAGVPRP